MSVFFFNMFCKECTSKKMVLKKLAISSQECNFIKILAQLWILESPSNIFPFLWSSPLWSTEHQMNSYRDKVMGIDHIATWGDVLVFCGLRHKRYWHFSTPNVINQMLESLLFELLAALNCPKNLTHNLLTDEEP